MAVDPLTVLADPPGQPALSEELFAQVVRAVRLAMGIDLSPYRRSSALRRILRRMRQLEIDRVEAYVERLLADRDEAQRIGRELLLSSGNLLRDPDVYANLSRRLPGLLAEARRPQFWVPACGSGEEVFTVAMLVAEAQGAREAPDDFIVFGTDLDAPSLDRAREALISPRDAERLPPHLRDRYLQAEADGYRVVESLASRCVFLSHDVLQPAPFSGLDLICCRNLLMYLQLPAQRRLLELFHRTLRPGGLLMVGRSEALAAHHDLFSRRNLGPGLYERGGSTPAVISAPEAVEPAYRQIFDLSSTPAALVDADGRIQDANSALCSLFSESRSLLLGRPLGDLFERSEGARVVEALSRLPPDAQQQLSLTLASGPEGRRAQRLSLRRPPTGSPNGVLAEFHADLSVEQVEQHLLVQSSRLITGLKLMSEGMVATDPQGQIIEINPAAERITGWSRAEALGQPHDRVVRLVGGGGAVQASPLWTCLRENRVLPRGSQEHYLLSRDGRRLTLRLACAPLAGNGSPAGALLLFEDATEQSLLAEELAYRAAHDPITGLLNRDEFERRLSAAVTEAQRGGVTHVLCYFDVDQFKVVNDTLGHYAGDDLLRQMAAVLRARLRPQDALARLGGDEFGVLLARTDEAAARPLVDSLLEAARQFRFQWDGQGYASTISVGVALLDRQTESTARVLSAADAACYAAKDSGRDRARWVSGDAEIQRRHGEMGLVTQIGRALDQNLFELFYEDVTSTREPRRIRYRELLIRMRGANGELLRPGGFIAAAERYYLMTALDRWVVSHALEGLARVPTDDIIYAVNVSGLSLSDEKFLQYTINCLDQSGVAPERVCFEITETAAISHLSEAVRFIQRLAELGCRFALDDFGAGMASFSYLKNLPVHFIKIDGSFVRTMRESRVDRGMVEAINRIGHEMGLTTIAEHVEDASLLEALAGMGVDWAQGQAVACGRPFTDLHAH
ncbi:MAG TPA: EAL domain-containing protein [Nevskiaceae bacterium]|nr:EAL domain-containing protein [Nevskiaceae bacterium]